MQGTGDSVWKDLSGDALLIRKDQLIDSILRGNPKKLITAPRGFGKSTNLEVLKMHLCADQRDNASSASARGACAVLYVNLFAHEPVRTQQKTYDLLREIVHVTYLEHAYLASSDRLEPRERDICERWSGLRFVEMTNHSVTMGLTHLTQFLHKHWYKQVVLLVDEYDSIIMNALAGATNAEFALIRQLVNGQISKLVKYNRYVSRAVIVGESVVVGSELAANMDLELIRFLGDHLMVKYFGFTDDEIDQILTKSNSGKTRDELRSWYGYTTECGSTTYNPFSVHKFIEEGSIMKSYWRQKGHVNSIARFYEITYVKECLQKLLRRECAPITIASDVSTTDIVTLKEFLEGLPESTSHQRVHDLFFTHLFDQGYLAFSSNDSSCITIPNVEVEQELSTTMAQHYCDKHRLNPHQLSTCAKLLAGTHSVASREGFQHLLTALFHSLGLMLKEYVTHGGDISSVEELTEILFAVTNRATGFVTKSQLKTDYLDEDNKTKKDTLDIYMRKESFGIIIEISHAKSKSPNSKASLQKILDRRYYRVFENKLYSPGAITKFVFIGLSTNYKGILSISGLMNSKNMTESITERKLQRPPVARNYSRKTKSTRLKTALFTTPVYVNDSTEAP